MKKLLKLLTITLAFISSLFVIPFGMNINKEPQGIVYNVGISEDYKIEDKDSEEVKMLIKYIKLFFVPYGDNNDKYKTPSDCYLTLINDNMLLGDCDDFASLTYHILANNDIECYYLCTWGTLFNGHLNNVYVIDNQYYYADYYKASKGFNSLKELLKEYNNYYYENYNHKVVNNYLMKYSYTTGLFYLG